jgi:hypothetical protein
MAMEYGALSRILINVNNAEGALPPHDNSHPLKPDTLCPKAFGYQSADQIFARQGEKLSLRTQARAGDKGRADQPPSLHPIVSDRRRAPRRDSGGDNDMIEATYSGTTYSDRIGHSQASLSIAL